MNICLLTRHPGYRATGITRMSTEILRGLRNRKHSVQVVATKHGSLPSYFKFTLIDIPIQIKGNGMDIYHAATSPMEGIWLPKERSVVTYCDLIPILYTERFGSGLGYSKWKRFIGKAYSEYGWKKAARAKIVTCTSDHVKRELVEHLGVSQEKIRVIRMGIREDLTPCDKRDGTFRIGTLGQLDRRKRVDLLIKSFRRSDIDGELVIAGIGMDEILLKDMAGADRRIKFLGQVPDDELADFYNSLDVFVFPTWVEGYGLPMVEAMACKKPVIVLEDAIIPHDVKGKCIVAENLDDVFTNLNHLADLSRLTDIEGNYRFAKEHSWDDYVDELVKIYQEVLSER